jgi:putative peptidoglycan lipid II flippase
VTGLTNTATIYTLPVSLFGISVSAAQLPALSRDAALAETGQLRARIDRGLARLTFFVVPSAVAFATVGDVIAGVLLQHGRFSAADSRIIWGMLAGSAIGLVASTQSRLYSVAHYALGDTKKPLRFALVRIALVGILGYLAARVIPPLIGVPPMWGAAGLTGSAGVAGWIEFALLRHSLDGRIGRTGVPASRMAILWGAAIAGAAVAWGVKYILPWSNPLLRGALILPAFGVTYLACTALAGIDVRHQLLRD